MNHFGFNMCHILHHKPPRIFKSVLPCAPTGAQLRSQCEPWNHLRKQLAQTRGSGRQLERSTCKCHSEQGRRQPNDDLDAELDAEAGASWGDDDLLGGGDQGSDGDAVKDAQIDDDDLDGGDAGGGWGIDELDLPESPGQAQALAGGKGSKSSAFLPPSSGDSAVAMWLSNANAAGCTPET